MVLAHIPYAADAASLPAPLPTTTEIHSSEDVLVERTRCKVVGVGEHFVVKYGFGVSLLEGESMRFVRESTSVPVPALYASFQIPEPKNASYKKTYLIMERIRGVTLESLWLKLDESAKKAIVSKLQLFFDELRKLESPGGYCALGGRGLPDYVFWTPHNLTKAFNTESDFNEGIIGTYLGNGLPRYRVDFYSRAFKAVFQNHPPTFSHGDVQKKNFMICTHEGDEFDSGKFKVVLIDWETAGWYPSYWEYARTIFACGPWDDDWNVWVDKFLKPAFKECILTWLYSQDRC
ncbi:MAG: hypothetical protein Q9160_006766 [Pyrenula sp. 1 TL-2023]